MSQDPQPARRSRLTPLHLLLSSRLAIGVGMLVSRTLPPLIGHALGDLIAAAFNWLKPNVYRIVYANLRQVVGAEVDEKELHRLVRQVFRNNARNVYGLWHTVSRGPEAIRAAVHFPLDARESVFQALERGKGAIVAGAHTGSFDLSILAMATHVREVQILGLAAPPTGGYDLMDKLREITGARLTPIGIEGLREALKRLRAGGIVLTGVDRPVGDEEPTVEFFGRPALLPTGHVRLALKTDAVVFVAGAYRDPRRGNTVRLSPPIEMLRTGDPEEDLQVNLRRVTAWLEEFIRAHPEQWAMFLPVWPEEPHTVRS